jgi:two-component system, NarL family, nitrate/nitrite response regulator NarL
MRGGKTMKTVPTCIVGGNNLFREGLKSLLAGTEYRPISLCQQISEFQGTRLEPKLFLVGLHGSDADETAPLRAVRARYPDSRIVVVTTASSRQQFAACLAAGMAGYLVADVARQVLLESVRLVMRGVQVFPTMLVTGMLAGGGERDPQTDSDASSRRDEPQRLSPREQDILALLVEGASNKNIGIRLQIEDSTVKVHLRKILKKIPAANRTQAAVWAADTQTGVWEPFASVDEPIQIATKA